MRRFLILLAVLLAGCATVNRPNGHGGTGSDDSDTIYSLSNVNPALTTYGGTLYPVQVYDSLSSEDAGRWQEQGFGNMVSTFANANSCLGGTSAGLTMTPVSCVAYNAGFRSTETGSITFSNGASTWVAMDENTSGNNANLPNFTRVTGTHYLIDSIDVSKPTMASDSQLLMLVVTSGGAITAVTDERTTSPFGPATITPVTGGGTGLSAVTAHDLLIGNGTSPLTLISCAANDFLAGVSSANPACRALLASDVPGFDGVTVTGTPSAGETLVATSGTAAGWSSTAFLAQLRAYKPTDQSVTSSTTLVNDNNLLFPIAANEIWQFEIDLYATFSTTALSGIKAAFTVPSGATVQWNDVSTTDQAGTSSGASMALGAGGSPSNPGVYFGKLVGQVLNGSTAGTVQLQWAQNTSDATATKVKAGSSLLATRMSP